MLYIREGVREREGGREGERGGYNYAHFIGKQSHYNVNCICVCVQRGKREEEREGKEDIEGVKPINKFENMYSRCV